MLRQGPGEAICLSKEGFMEEGATGLWKRSRAGGMSGIPQLGGERFKFHRPGCKYEPVLTLLILAVTLGIDVISSSQLPHRGTALLWAHTHWDALLTQILGSWDQRRTWVPLQGGPHSTWGPTKSNARSAVAVAEPAFAEFLLYASGATISTSYLIPHRSSR